METVNPYYKIKEVFFKALTDSAFHSANLKHYPLFESVSDKVEEAWSQWDDEYTEAFWEYGENGQEGEKQDTAPESFIKAWIDNWDMEADGFDVESLEVELSSLIK